MRAIFRKWAQRYFGDEEALILLLLLVVSFTVILTMGDIIAPVIAAMVIAFLLQGMISRLVSWRVPRSLAFLLTFVVFTGFFLLIFLVVLPLAWQQLTNLFSELPRMLAKGQELLMAVPEQYPQFFSPQQIEGLIQLATEKLGMLGQWVVSFSLSNIPNLLALGLYLVLVPILAFFLLKDQDSLMQSMRELLPEKRPLMNRIWHEMNDQIANYVRGKAIEILVVGGVSYVAFVALSLNYAALLAILVGLSVVVPYIGATLVTIPVALIGFFQWGGDSQFAYLMLTYLVIQFLDGNVLVPLLFSEAVNLTATAIIVAVIVFGGLWGMWGVFFAIPLATLIKAVLNAWPRQATLENGAQAE
jgi:putative permease